MSPFCGYANVVNVSAKALLINIKAIKNLRKFRKRVGKTAPKDR